MNVAGKKEWAAYFADQFLQLLPDNEGRRKQLIEDHEKTEILRTDYIEATAQEELDEDYNALCRYFIISSNFSVKKNNSFDF